MLHENSRELTAPERNCRVPHIPGAVSSRLFGDYHAVLPHLPLRHAPCRSGGVFRRSAVVGGECAEADRRRDGGSEPLCRGEVHRARAAAPRKAGLIIALNNGPVEKNSHYGKPLKIVDKEFTRGIACHATSKIVVQLPSPGKKFLAQIGLDKNEQTASGHGSVVFSVGIDGRNVLKSDVFNVTMPAKSVEVDLQGAREFVLEVGDAGDGIGWDQADWADARVELADGKTVWLGDLPILDVQDGLFSADPPFSFTYNGKPSAEFLGTWKVERKTKKLDEHRTAPHRHLFRSRRRALGALRGRRVRRFPTVEWTLYFKNTGTADTPIIENIQSLDIRWQRGRDSEFLLHHNIGAPADGTDYTPLETVLGGNATKRISARRADVRPTPTCRTSTWSGARTRG